MALVPEMNDGEMTAVATDAGLLWRSDADIESLVKFMRERGFSQTQPTEALERVTGFEVIEAQIAVIYSETGRDRFQQNVQLNPAIP
jgi:hypothetical protein